MIEFLVLLIYLLINNDNLKYFFLKREKYLFKFCKKNDVFLRMNCELLYEIWKMVRFLFSLIKFDILCLFYFN